MSSKRCLLGEKIKPRAIGEISTIRELVVESFCAFNSARLRVKEFKSTSILGTHYQDQIFPLSCTSTFN